MRYFYEYKIKNGVKVGGHNLEKITIIDDVIILEGVDTLMDCDGEYDHHWRSIINEEKIEYLKIEPMEDEEDKPIIEKLDTTSENTLFTMECFTGIPEKAQDWNFNILKDKLNEIIEFLNDKFNN